MNDSLQTRRFWRISTPGLLKMSAVEIAENHDALRDWVVASLRPVYVPFCSAVLILLVQFLFSPTLSAQLIDPSGNVSALGQNVMDWSAWLLNVLCDRTVAIDQIPPKFMLNYVTFMALNLGFFALSTVLSLALLPWYFTSFHCASRAAALADVFKNRPDLKPSNLHLAGLSGLSTDKFGQRHLHNLIVILFFLFAAVFGSILVSSYICDVIAYGAPRRMNFAYGGSVSLHLNNTLISYVPVFALLPTAVIALGGVYGYAKRALALVRSTLSS